MGIEIVEIRWNKVRKLQVTKFLLHQLASQKLPKTGKKNTTQVVARICQPPLSSEHGLSKSLVSTFIPELSCEFFKKFLQQVSHDLTHLMKATGEGKEKREFYDAYAQCACEVCRHSCRAWTQEELASVPECLTGTGCKYQLAIIGPTLIRQCRTYASVKPVSPTIETSKCTHVQLDSSIQSLQ